MNNRYQIVKLFIIIIVLLTSCTNVNSSDHLDETFIHSQFDTKIDDFNNSLVIVGKIKPITFGGENPYPTIDVEVQNQSSQSIKIDYPKTKKYYFDENGKKWIQIIKNDIFEGDYILKTKAEKIYVTDFKIPIITGAKEYLLLIEGEMLENGTPTGKHVGAYRIIKADQ